MKCIYSIAAFLTTLSFSAFSQPYNYSEYSFDTVLTSEGGESRISFKSFSFDGLPEIQKGVSSHQQQIDENRRMLQMAEKREKEIALVKKIIKNQKIAYFTETIGLTEDEGSKFWPIYIAYEKALDDIMMERQKLSYKISECSQNYTPNDEKYCSHYLATVKKEWDVAQEYLTKFKQVLPPQKVLLLYNAELEFKKLVFRRFKGELF